MNKALETVGAVHTHTHTHTHTSQFLNKRNGIEFSDEGAFCGADVCAESVTSGYCCALDFVNYIEDS